MTEVKQTQLSSSEKKGVLSVTNSYRTRNEVLFRLILADAGSIAAFGRKIGISRSYVSQIVNGFREASNAEKIKFARALNVDSRTIFP